MLLQDGSSSLLAQAKNLNKKFTRQAAWLWCTTVL
jgi:hypothetical protein